MSVASPAFGFKIPESFRRSDCGGSAEGLAPSSPGDGHRTQRPLDSQKSILPEEGLAPSSPAGYRIILRVEALKITPRLLRFEASRTRRSGSLLGRRTINSRRWGRLVWRLIAHRNGEPAPWARRVPWTRRSGSLHRKNTSPDRAALICEDFANRIQVHHSGQRLFLHYGGGERGFFLLEEADFFFHRSAGDQAVGVHG